MTWLSWCLQLLAVFGVVIVAAQAGAAWLALRKAPRRSTTRGVSVLKPLCGLDDALDENLLTFVNQTHGRYEVLLGVESEGDAAYPVALAAARTWPAVFRVVVQQGAPGLNPKVNQLSSLARAAAHDVLLISDSNMRVHREYVAEVAAAFDDVTVGCATNPVSGAGHQSFGAMLDNLHLAAGIGAAQLATEAIAGRGLVVGKSMAVRREVLATLGGFAAYADILAEDYVIGQHVRALGKRVAMVPSPVMNVAVRRTVGSFWRRYLRWGVIHRTSVSLPTSLAQALINPWPLSAMAVLINPGFASLAICAAVLAAKAMLDGLAARVLRATSVGHWLVPAVAVKDLLLFAAWAHGLVARTVTWRGHPLRVTHGSRLIRPALSSLEPVTSEATR